MAEVGHHVLTMAELEAGLTDLIKAAEDGGGVDNTVISVAKKVIRELYETRGESAALELISLAEFEQRATAHAAQLPTWWADKAQGRRKWTLDQGFSEQAPNPLLTKRG